MRVYLNLPWTAAQTKCQAHRSKSLTHIEYLDVEMAKRDDVDSKSEPGSFSSSSSRDQLLVPGSEDDGGDRERRGKLKKCPRKVSSQEFFSISFDVLEEPGYEILPAVRGNTIKDALALMLDRKGLDFYSVAVYQDNAHSPLPLNYDISKLGGCHLRVKAKDGINADAASVIKSASSKERLTEAQRKSTGSTRSLKGLLGLSSDESYGNFGGDSLLSGGNAVQGCQDGSWKMGKTRSQGKLSGLFSNPFKDKEKMEVLTDILNRYSQHGIPKLPYIINFDSDQDDADVLYLEESWTHVVDNPKLLSDRTWQQQCAVWELLTTEVSYLRKLKVIQELFIYCLCNLQNEKILNEVDIDKLFGNIQEIYHTNLTLWKKCLLPMLNHSRANKLPFDPTLVKESFLKFDQLFYPYTKFFLEQISCIRYLKELYQDNEQFKAYLAWCEAQKQCNRQRLVDLLVKPMERLTKYALLLKVIHKRSDDGEQKAILLEMIRSVESFVSGTNSTLRQQHEQERLANIINRIDSYEPVDVKDDDIEKFLKPYLELDLTSPMPGCAPQHSRQLLMEGDLRLKDTLSGKMDVHCFLFTDMLLICKSLAKKGDRVKVIRQPYVVDRLEIHEMKDSSGLLLVYLNEYNVATSVFTLHGNDIRNWLEAIRKAQDHFKDVKTSRPEVIFYVRDDDDFDFATNGISMTKSPKGSGGSSLIHSHSGSVELSEPASTTVNHSRATSLEFSEKRASSASSDEGSTSEMQKSKPHPREPRNAQPVSPRPERRIFLLKGSSGGSGSPNTLSVGYPYADSAGPKPPESSPTSLTIPSSKPLSPKTVAPAPQSPRMLRRSFPVSQSSKPPLVKTKNLVKGAAEECNSDEPTCFDFDIPVIMGLSSNQSSDDEEAPAKAALAPLGSAEPHPCQRRHLLTDRRYHTADSIEHLKGGGAKEAGIQKRLSWHFGQRTNHSAPAAADKLFSYVHPISFQKQVAADPARVPAAAAAPPPPQVADSSSPRVGTHEGDLDPLPPALEVKPYYQPNTSLDGPHLSSYIGPPPEEKAVPVQITISERTFARSRKAERVLGIEFVTDDGSFKAPDV